MISIPLLKHLSTSFNHSIDNTNISSIGGGSINQTYRISLNDSASYFCKTNSATKFPHLFAKEKKGLELLAQQKIIKTPDVIDCFSVDDQQVLLLQWIESGERTIDFWKKFGAQLAALHAANNDTFGLYEDNYMGSVLQLNKASATWVAFFNECRLQPLLNQCLSQKLLSNKHMVLFERINKQLPHLFTEEKPALVHGDLWSGNFMCNKKGEPVLIDPAVYYGHRSVDLGMTTLFGGFDKSFYEAYHYHYPLPHNYKEQWEVCNLYPLLIHLLLFGKSYLYQIDEILKHYQ